MFMRVICSLCLLALAFSSVADDLLWDKLRQEANMVVLMRNTESSGNRDGAGMLVWDASGRCEGESTLTTEGRTQARKIGLSFAKRGIRPKVISSPMCRCTETAQLAFGHYLTDPDLRQRPASDPIGQETFQGRAEELLKQHRGEIPVVFVNHRPNIDALAMELLGTGELLVGAISADGEVEVFGKIRVDP
jgi:broad specificity phosphatase PhoE